MEDGLSWAGRTAEVTKRYYDEGEGVGGKRSVVRPRSIDRGSDVPLPNAEDEVDENSQEDETDNDNRTVNLV